MCIISSRAQQGASVTRIEFNKGSRTTHEQVIITPDSVHVIDENFQKDKNTPAYARPIDAKEWKSLLQIVQKIDVKELASLKAPSDKRATDSALHGSIIITTAGGQSYTHGFDNEDPHQKLVPLMKEIRKISDRTEHDKHASNGKSNKKH
jgi:hypothetical protein